MNEKQRPILKPHLFGKYCLLERVSVGGMAEVFRAKPFDLPDFQGYLALKRILPHLAEDDEFIKMFIDEAKLTVRLNHPNVIRTYELGQFGDASYILMEFVSGRDLLALQKKMRRSGQIIDVQAAAFIAREMANGLQHAHLACDDKGAPLNVIHRDVSPQNVLLAYTGAVKVIDFGIAKAAVQNTRTQVGVLKGKMGYMSPEQVHGLEIDSRSDIFAVGTVLWEMLTNRRLFSGANEFETLKMLQNPRVPATYDLNPDVSPELDRVVRCALNPDRDQRFQTAEQLANALSPFLEGYGTPQFGEWIREVFFDELEDERYKHAEFQKIRTPEDVQQRILDAYTEPSGDPGASSERTGMWDADIQPEDDEDLVQFAHEHTVVHEGGFDLDLIELDTSELDLLELAEETEPEHESLDFDLESDDPPMSYRTELAEDTQADRTTPTRPRALYWVGIATVFVSAMILAGAVAWVFLFSKDGAVLTIESEPSGATIVVNGEPAGNAPVTIDTFSVGDTVKVSATMEGYKPQSKSVALPEQSNLVSVALAAVIKNYSVNFEGVSPTDVIFVDGVEESATEVVIPAGEHLFEVFSAGNTPWSKIVDLQSDIVLRPESRPARKKVVPTVPEGAVLTVDGNQVVESFDLSPATLHNVELTAGKQKWQTFVGFPERPDESWTLNFESPATAEDQFGWLILPRATSNWSIAIDGVATGMTTPVKSANRIPIQVGPRTVELTRGKRRHEFKIDVKPKQTVMVRESLEFSWP